MSRFPKVTETFVLYEILAVEKLGVRVEIFPLMREHQRVVHPEAKALADRAHYLPFMSAAILLSQLYLLVRRPRRYIGALAGLIRGTMGSRNYLFGGLAIFPKAAHAALQMERLGITHVHCHFSNHPATAGYLVRRISGIPFSFTAHGSDVHVDRHMLCSKLREAQFAVTVSEFNRQVMMDECGTPARSVEVVRSGVDTEVFRPGAQTPDSDTLRIICVGTLHEVKGQTVLLQACAKLAESAVPFECTFVGDGPDEEALRAQAGRIGLGHRVTFVGPQQRHRIAELLRSSDVLVAPSVPASDGKREGIPVVLMEAMASGLPAVASRLAGIPELVLHDVTGLLVEPRDHDGMATALERLHRDHALRHRLGRAGRERILADFNLSATARYLVDRFAESSR